MRRNATAIAILQFVFPTYWHICVEHLPILRVVILQHTCSTCQESPMKENPTLRFEQGGLAWARVPSRTRKSHRNPNCTISLMPILRIVLGGVPILGQIATETPTLRFACSLVGAISQHMCIVRFTLGQTIDPKRQRNSNFTICFSAY